MNAICNFQTTNVILKQQQMIVVQPDLTAMLHSSGVVIVELLRTDTSGTWFKSEIHIRSVNIQCKQDWAQVIYFVALFLPALEIKEK